MQLLLIFLVFLVSLPCFSSNNPYPTQDLEKDITRFSNTSGWHALLYYNSRSLRGGWLSEADDPDFFISELGKINPEVELSASINAMFLENNVDESHFLCRFPARSTWIINTFDIDRENLPKISCKELAKWRKLANAEGVTLVFPAAYLNSPSSMFGHSFLRLDQKNQNKHTELLAYSVNYAANTSSDDGKFAFIYKGLFGGYPGVTSVLPYYMKIKEYSDMESRDIWEYKLNLNLDEVNLLVDHVWELQDIKFDYFFFKENCSYRLLGLLDVVRPENRMAADFNTHAIPVDTIRKVQKHNFVEDVVYRPSATSRFQAVADLLEKSEKKWVRKYVMDANRAVSDVDQFDQDHRGIILDAAYQYSRLAPLAREQGAKKSLDALKKIKEEDYSDIVAVPTPLYRDDDGHLSALFQLSLGSRDNNVFTQITSRPAFHELTSPSKGYLQGLEIKFFELQARLYEDGDFEVEDATVVSIKSFTPSDLFFRPKSWKVRFGAKRIYHDNQRFLSPVLEGGFGRSKMIGPLLAYGLVGGELLASKKLSAYQDVKLNANIGALWRSDLMQINLDYQVSDSVTYGSEPLHTLRFHHEIHITTNFSGNISATRERLSGEAIDTLSFGINMFF